MKTLLVLSVLLCASFAAPAEDKEKAPEAAAEALKEQIVAVPAPVLDEAAAPESHFISCPNGWSRHGSHCYLFIHHPMSWYSAEEHCNGLGGHLASATNPAEYSFLQQMTQTAGQSIAWLGGFNLQGRWMWIDSEGFYYTNWYSPSSSSSYPCVYLRSSNGWGNTQCSSGNRFICSKSPFSC
ncbi:ladderlectin-like [Clinocottus analis]|uniref:ladderlectin-like n=1 Tax=Clinocottus analis TaxID=304258 RepID=UPI0035BFB6B5